jgi:[acyl-carrier-protein] S-malonyltransferase
MIDKSKTAFVFPGAAVEPCGAEAAFYAKHRETMSPFISQASEAAGADLQECIENNRLGALDEKTSQIFTFAFSHGVAQAHIRAGVTPAVLAGYSLGIYAALSVSGALGFTESLSLVGSAFDIMMKNCVGGPFAMGAVLGLSNGETDSLCATGAYPSVLRTNTNNETCGVFSGKKEELERFFKDARDRGALSTVAFSVGVPYHHPEFISNASGEFLQSIRSLSWRDARLPVISSIDQKLLVKPREFAEFIAGNLVTPLHWQKVVETLGCMGVGTVYECGPGISLCQNGRFIHNGLRYVTIKKNIRKETA